VTRNVANGARPKERSNDRGAERARPAGHNDMALMIVHGQSSNSLMTLTICQDGCGSL
jgi:hypothetical protein